jgi:hypothetical protein
LRSFSPGCIGSNSDNVQACALSVDRFQFDEVTSSVNPANYNAVNTTKCANLWTGLLQNPPTTLSVTAHSSATPQTYRVENVGATECPYTYRPIASPVRRFDYNITAGTVTLVNS